MSVDWVLVGRSAELARVEAALTHGRSGVVLCGPAGVGKTRLALELIQQYRRHRPVVWAAASRPMAAIPFGAVAHLLTGPGTGAGAVTASPLDVIRLVSAEARRRSPGQPLMLGIDDAHLLDPQSAALVHHLAATRAAFVIVTLRVEEPAPDPIRALWKDGIADRIELGPLTRTDVAELLAAALHGPVHPATAHRLWVGSGGNSLFLRELVLLGRETGRLNDNAGTWIWTGPLAGGSRLSELIEDRLAGLAEIERAALEVLAVGDPLPADLYAEVVGSQVALGLEAKGLLVSSTDGGQRTVAAGHPLFTENLRAGIGPLRRQAISRRLADAQAAIGVDRQEEAVRLALWQLDGGGDLDARNLTMAARHATWLFDHGLAERFARAALAAGGGQDTLVTLAESLLWQGRSLECRDVLARLHESASHPEELDEALVAQAAFVDSTNAFWGLGDADAARGALLAAEAHLPLGEHRDRVRGQRAVIEFFAGRATEAVAATEPRSADDRTASPTPSLLGRGRLLGLAAVGRTSAALELATGMLECSAPLGERPLLLGELHGGLALALWQAGRFPEMEAECAAAYEQVIAARAHDFVGFVACQLGRAHLGTGRIRDARDRLTEAVSGLRNVDVMGVLPLALAWLARCHAHLGDLGAARTLLDECDHVWRRAMAAFAPDIGLSRAWVAAAAGEHSRARRVALEAAGTAAQMRFGPLELEALHDAVRLGERGLARRLAGISARIENDLGPAFVEHAAALDPAADGHRLDAVARQFAELGASLLAAECAVEAAEAYARAGRRGSELSSLRRAQQWSTCSGGARTPVLARAGQAPELGRLTAREREITELAASGLGNREIAERLVLSIRTVGNHLNAAYGKLGVSDRTELISFFRRPGTDH